MDWLDQFLILEKIGFSTPISTAISTHSRARDVEAGCPNYGIAGAPFTRARSDRRVCGQTHPGHWILALERLYI